MNPGVYNHSTESFTFLGDIWPGPTSSLPRGTRFGNDDGPFILHEGYLYFQASDSVHGSELWRSDGTAEGTAMVADINPGPGSSLPDNFLAVGSSLLFTAIDPDAGNELFIIDSPGSTPRLFQDINPGPPSSNPSGYFHSPQLDLIFFTATTDTAGRELWALPASADGFPTAADRWFLYE